LTVGARTATIVLTMTTQRPIVRFNSQLLAEDMASKGWNKSDLAVRAGVADMTVIRFLRAESQTNRTAKKLARALGYSVRRYLVSATVAA